VPSSCCGAATPRSLRQNPHNPQGVWTSSWLTWKRGIAILATVTQPEYLTTGEAAAVLGVSDETLRRWADDRKVRHVRLPSGQLRFIRSDLDAVLAPVEAAAPSPAGSDAEAKS